MNAPSTKVLALMLVVAPLIGGGPFGCATKPAERPDASASVRDTNETASRATATIRVRLLGLSTDRGDGPVRVALWPGASEFMVAGKWLQAASIPIGDAREMLEFRDVPLGRYAVSAFHDVTDCGQFRRDALGLPRDPWAVSGGSSPWLPPNWRRAAFDLTTAGATIELRFAPDGASGKSEQNPRSSTEAHGAGS